VLLLGFLDNYNLRRYKIMTMFLCSLALVGMVVTDGIIYAVSGPGEMLLTPSKLICVMCVNITIFASLMCDKGE